MICCSGGFEFLSFFDSQISLDEDFRINTRRIGLHDSELGSEYNLRVVRIPLQHGNSDESTLVAVSCDSLPNAALLYDWDSDELVAWLRGRQQMQCWGLAAFSSSLFETPRILTGGVNGVVLLFDIDGIPIGRLRSWKVATHRIIWIPEWENSIVIAGGIGNSLGKIHRYDLRKGLFSSPVMKYGREENHHNGCVWGVAACTNRNLLFSVAADEKIRMWAIKSRTCHHVSELSSWGCSCCLSEDQNSLFVGLKEGGIECWDVRNLGSPVASWLDQIDGQPSFFVHDLARVGEDAFVSGSYQSLAMWNRFGKIAHQAKMPDYVNGVCLLDETGAGPTQRAENERIVFLQEMELHGLAWVVAWVGRGVRIPLWV